MYFQDHHTQVHAKLNKDQTIEDLLQLLMEKKKLFQQKDSNQAFIAKIDSEMEGSQRPNTNNSQRHPTNTNTVKLIRTKKELFARNINFK